MPRDPSVQPDVSRLERIEPAEATTLAAPPLPVTPPAPAPFLRSPLPPSQLLQPDTLRQFYRIGNPQNRINPLPPAGIPQINSTAQGIAKTVTATAISNLPVPATGLIGINEQSGTTYTVQQSDLDTLISFSNNSGGAITLPGGSGGGFVQTGHSTGASPQTVLMTNTGGNLLVAVTKTNLGGLTFPVISDSNGNTWNLLGGNVDAGNTPTAMFYAFNVAAGANNIVCTLVSGTIFTFTVLEYHGIPTTNPLDRFAIGGSGNANYGTPLITTGVPNALCVVGITIGGSATNPGPGPGWTQRYNESGFGTDQDLIAAASGTTLQGTTNLIGASNPYVGGIASFQTVFSSVPFPKGWFCYIENTGTGTFDLQSLALIDGSASPVSIASNTGLFLAFDGANWLTERGIGGGGGAAFYQTVQQATVSKTQRPILNFLAPITATDDGGNTSTDIAVPVMVGDSGAGGVAGLVPAAPSGSAAANDFLSADGTFKPTHSIGGVSLQSGNYTTVGADYGKLLAFSVSGGALAFVQFTTANAGGGLNTITSPSITLTAGNAVFVSIFVGNGSAQTVSTVTDTLGNTYTFCSGTHAFNGAVFGGVTSQIWFAENILGGTTTITATWPSGGGFSAISLAEFSGVAPSSADDANTSNATNSTPSLNVTTTGATDLAIASIITPGTFTWSNMTDRTGGGGIGFGSATVTPAGSFTATSTGSASDWVGALATFKTATGSGNTLTLPASPPFATWMIFVQNYGTNNVIVNPNGLQLDASGSNVTLTPGTGIIIFTDNTNYFSCRN